MQTPRIITVFALLALAAGARAGGPAAIPALRAEGDAPPREPRALTSTCPAPLTEELLSPDLQDKTIHPTAASLGFAQSIEQGLAMVYVDQPPAGLCTTRYLMTIFYPLNKKAGSSLQFVPTPGANITPSLVTFSGAGVVAVVELVWVPRAPTWGIWVVQTLRDD